MKYSIHLPHPFENSDFLLKVFFYRHFALISLKRFHTSKLPLSLNFQIRKSHRDIERHAHTHKLYTHKRKENEDIVSEYDAKLSLSFFLRFQIGYRPENIQKYCYTYTRYSFIYEDRERERGRVWNRRSGCWVCLNWLA